VTDTYLVEHIQAALADKVGELGVKVALAGDGVFLTGELASAERSDAVAAVVAEVVGDRIVHNQTTVMDYPEPVESEQLS
jgi:osmotically-inducible protein OsmY